jgi:hypothetical protein
VASCASNPEFSKRSRRAVHFAMKLGDVACAFPNLFRRYAPSHDLADGGFHFDGQLGQVAPRNIASRGPLIGNRLPINRAQLGCPDIALVIKHERELRPSYLDALRGRQPSGIVSEACDFVRRSDQRGRSRPALNAEGFRASGLAVMSLFAAPRRKIVGDVRSTAAYLQPFAYFSASAMKSAGPYLASADLAKCGFAEMKFSGAQ